MDTPKTLLGNMNTRGDLRRLSERSLRVSEHTSENELSVSAGSPLWDLWRFLSEFYGAAFSTQYGDEPNRTWAHSLRELSPADIRKVMELMPTRESSFPPNPAEIIALLGCNQDWERQCHRIDETIALEDKTAHERRCAAGLDRIRNIRQEAGL